MVFEVPGVVSILVPRFARSGDEIEKYLSRHLEMRRKVPTLGENVRRSMAVDRRDKR
jgi:hypothetical protein